MVIPNSVTLVEVGPRDGLQNEKQQVPTDSKIQFIRELKKAGFNEMELTSFVSPKWVPQLADAKEVLTHCLDHDRNIVLTPNEKGVQLARKSSCQNVAFFVGVSNTFNQKNINSTTEESVQKLLPLIKELKASDFYIRACISTSFYCPYEGKVKEEDVLALCRKFVEAGVDDLSVADTIGMANPSEVFSLFSKLKLSFPNVLITAHFHDTRGMALANIYAALQAGVDRFDSSAGGIGGCPFAPGASGNVATEDVVFMLDQMGVETGIDLQQVLKAVEGIEPHLSKPVESKMYRLYKSTFLKEKAALNESP
ncbi:hydroxymethylglutaryl-CoA lyase [Metabacillus herbersteinensis]|uniref:Hydroxymethylglutaryl-CoA lyase n=1 Tax=Metabacillus herbersteinensis TaxID=283816 RepID=A0ABV6GCU1_9BACI